MLDQTIALTDTRWLPAETTQAISQLRQAYTGIQELFQAQPSQVQRFLDDQAASIAAALLQPASRVRFSLPERVKLIRNAQLAVIPLEMRQQTVGKEIHRLTGKDLRTELHRTLLELEQSPDPGISTSAALLRYAIAVTLVHDQLPAGRAVTYTTLEGDTLPSIPVPCVSDKKPAHHNPQDTLLGTGWLEDEPDAQQVPYVEAARHFYLPQWVPFDDQGRLLVGSSQEAEAHLASMQRYLSILHAAVGLAPYLAADEDYQQKRYGILGQLINQGRAFARYQLQDIIQTIQHRVTEQNLNRGLHLSLPYFDDQELCLKIYAFDVIPAGRILFVPAFVVRAAHEQQVKIAQDTRLSPGTRRHLLTLLYRLGIAFYPADGEINKQ